MTRRKRCLTVQGLETRQLFAGDALGGGIFNDGIDSGGSRPIVGDWDGDGLDDIGLYLITKSTSESSDLVDSGTVASWRDNPDSLDAMFASY